MSTLDKKTRLDRGIDALFAGPHVDTAQVALERIERNPFQPRKEFDDSEMSAMTESIKAHGVLQPLVVRPVGEGYQLVAGERRLRAAKAAGLAAVPVRVVEFDDQQTIEAALVENLQRADLNPIEKALSFKDYLDRYKLTHDQLAARLGLGRATLTNLVGLLELPADVQSAVRQNQISLGHAKLLKGVTDRGQQSLICKQVIARGLSVHATDALIKEQLQGAARSGEKEKEPKEAKPAVSKTAHVLGIEDELRQKLSARVEIKLKARDKGSIVLTFESNDDFERLLDTLRK